MRLGVGDHDRGAAGLRYVYPVLSRRARGVSVGVNLNTNDACNWRCLYCQVPGLVRGSAPEVDLQELERELAGLLGEIARGDWMERHVPAGSRRLSDVAFSGNGEPTSSPQLEQAIAIAARILAELGLSPGVGLVLISNGSLVQRAEVQSALRRLAAAGGELWFKLDSATEEGQRRLNDAGGARRQIENLATAARLCRTWIQTMALCLDGEPPSDAERRAWLEAVGGVLRAGAPIAGVRLYGLARASHQPEAPRLAPVPPGWLEGFAREIEGLGLEVQVSP